MAVKRHLTHKQLLAGFGGHRRQQLAKPGPAKRRPAHAVRHGKMLDAIARKRSSVKRSSVKRSSVKSRLAKVGVLAGVTAAAAAAGVGVTKYVEAAGGVNQILQNIKNGYEAAGIGGAIAGLGVLTTPAMVNGVTNPIQPAQAEALFSTMQNYIPPVILASNMSQDITGNVYDEYGGLQL